MTWPTIFANLAGGNQNLALFDAMFNQVASMIAIPCTATGTNAIVLTPIGSAPTLTSYANFNFFRFLAVGNSTGAVTGQFTTLAALPVYKSDGLTQVAANDILSGQEYVLIFSQALNGGAGGFYLENAAVPVSTITAGGTFANLRVSNNVSFPDTRVDVTCDEVIMANTSGQIIRATAVSLTINLAVIGTNGIDAGAQGASGFYNIWLISNGTTTAGLASRSATGPTMPPGYTFKKRVGAIPADLCAGQSSAVTITNASPGVITWNNHGLVADTPVSFTAGGGVLPSQLVAGTQYYVVQQGLTTNTFQVAQSIKGVSINTSGGSGTVNAACPAVRLRRTLQYGNRTQYLVSAAGTGTAQLPCIASGAQSAIGTYAIGGPVYAAIPVGTYVPPTAFQIDLVADLFNASSGTASQMQVAPSNFYGGHANLTGTIPWFDTGGAAPTQLYVHHLGLMTLETTNIYWTATGLTGVLLCAGWIDNL